MKRLIIAVWLLLALCGCEKVQYPHLDYAQSKWGEEICPFVEVREGYVLNKGHSYDEIKTEDGYDLVLHFVKEDTDVH